MQGSRRIIEYVLLKHIYVSFSGISNVGAIHLFGRCVISKMKH